MHRPEAMLLVLVLALLGGANCGISTFYGATTGTHFCTSICSTDDIKEIRMYRNNIGRFLSIQIKYGGYLTPPYGVPGGKLFTFSVSDGEYITQVHGSYVANIRNMIMTTSLGRSYVFGKSAGEEFSDLPDQHDLVLKGLCGYYGFDGIRGVSFVWGKPQVNGTTYG